jgi:hypothetical protein
MIGARFEPSVSDTLELHLGANGTIDCIVRWIGNGRIGLEFAHETQLDCSADERAALLRDVIGQSYPELRSSQSPAPASGTGSFGKRPRGTDHRRAKRHPLIWSGILYTGTKTLAVRVRNISSSGAMVQCNCSAAVRGDARLELGRAGSLDATIGWTAGDQVGLCFHEQFDMSRLARSTPQLTPTKWVRPAYLDKVGADSSPWDPEWERLSIGDLEHELEGFLKR